MRATECLDLITSLEQRFPVERWRIDTDHVWPLVRAELWWDLCDENLVARGRLPQTPGRRWMSRLAVAVKGSAGHLVERSKARGRFLYHSADAILLGDNLSRVPFRGKWYDRICEPVMEDLDDKGLASFHMEPYHLYRRPRSRPSRSIQVKIDLARLSALVKPQRRTELEGLGEMRETIAREGLHTSACDPFRIARIAAQTRAISKMFARIIKRTDPSIAFLVEYSQVTRAFCLACSEANVPTVELQHGLISDLHWAYSRWTKVPHEGFAMLPDIYWTWSEQEAGIISQWASAAGPHRAFVGGNLWLNHWRHPTDPDIIAADASVTETVRRRGAEVNILVTLQSNLLGDLDIGPILEAATTRPDWKWWLRPHPTMQSDDLQRVRDLNRALGAEAVEPEVVGNLPLYAWLRHVQGHVTHSSSTVQEAAEFKVRSVVTGPESERHYKIAIERGEASAASTAAEIVQAIEEARTAEDRDAYVPEDPVQDLLELLSLW